MSYIKSNLKFENKILQEIKKNFYGNKILELLTIYNIFLTFGKFRLALKVRNYFFNEFNKSRFFFKSNYLKKLNRVDELLQNQNHIKLIYV